MQDLSRRGALALLAASLMAGAVRSQASEAPLDEAAIRALLAQFVDQQRRSFGVAVAFVSPQSRRIVTHGVLSHDNPRPIAGDTVFDIASATKTFTGLLLCEAVRRGEVRLEDPVAQYLPAGVRIPERGGRRITLVDLATHTAGLPFELPDTNSPQVLARAAADPMAPLYDLLRTTELVSDPGATWMYSNLGYGLLGEALARRVGVTYGDLVRRRITAPLRMHDTGLALTATMSARRAGSHLEDLSPGPEWNKPWARGAGGLKSTISDLAVYLSAYAGLTRSPLAPAMAATRSVLRPSPLLGGEWGLGWQVLPGGGQPIATHSGIGTGFSSCLAFDPATRTGVAVLSNARLPVTELGFHILRPSLPLAPPPPEPGAPDADLDRFVGRFTLDVPLATQRLPAGAVIEITRGPSGLLIQIPGAPRGPLTRSDPAHFVITGFPVEVEFRPDGADLVLTIARVSATATRAH